jgi:FMN phosphatase YigB (HAD superfamily)
MFDDVTAALRGAKSAGMGTCAVHSEGFGQNWELVRQEADYAIESFTDISYSA